MTECVLCQKPCVHPLSLAELCSFQSVHPVRVCPRCMAHFQSYQGKIQCVGCGREWRSRELCVDCVRWQQQYDTVLVNQPIFVYDRFFLDWIERFKFYGDYWCGWAVVPALQQAFDARRDAIVIPIPSSVTRTKERGFPTTHSLLQMADIPFCDALEYRGDGVKQSHKTRLERIKTAQPFALKKELVTRWRQQPVILFDDVYTTGRTVYHAWQCLKSEGAEVVTVCTLGR